MKIYFTSSCCYTVSFSFQRKLVQLKLEKGFDFGNVLLGGKVPVGKKRRKKKASNNNGEGNKASEEVPLVSFVCQEKLAGLYPAEAEAATKTAPTAAEAVKVAGEQVGKSKITLCHISLEEEEGGPWELLERFSTDLRYHTPSNGLFLAVWCPRDDGSGNATVGIVPKQQKQK